MYDVIFISYNELQADANWNKLKMKIPYAMRIHGIKGIHQAHIEAAKKAFTPMIWIVDADACIVDEFDFSYVPNRTDRDAVHVWRSRNPINDLEYGYGGVKLFPRLATVNMDTSKADMTTSISTKFIPMEQVSNITAFNTDEFSTWRSAFRECCKLASAVIDRQRQDETDTRLAAWCSDTGRNRQFGDFAICGARAGRKYGVDNQGNINALKKINDFDWLKEQFDANI
jgi:hypothetical protein